MIFDPLFDYWYWKDVDFSKITRFLFLAFGVVAFFAIIFAIAGLGLPSLMPEILIGLFVAGFVSAHVDAFRGGGEIDNNAESKKNNGKTLEGEIQENQLENEKKIGGNIQGIIQDTTNPKNLWESKLSQDVFLETNFQDRVFASKIDLTQKTLPEVVKQSSESYLQKEVGKKLEGVGRRNSI